VSWFTIASAALQLVLALVEWGKGRQQFTSGQDAEIAKTSLAILRKTDAGKKLMERIDAMSPAERDEFSDALGAPDPGPGAKS